VYHYFGTSVNRHVFYNDKYILLCHAEYNDYRDLYHLSVEKCNRMLQKATHPHLIANVKMDQEMKHSIEGYKIFGSSKCKAIM